MAPVEIFKTDIADFQKAEEIIRLLQEQLPACKINFDLEDCDKILRIQGHFEPDYVTQLIKKTGSICEQLA